MLRRLVRLVAPSAGGEPRDLVVVAVMAILGPLFGVVAVWAASSVVLCLAAGASDVGLVSLLPGLALLFALELYFGYAAGIVPAIIAGIGLAVLRRWLGWNVWTCLLASLLPLGLLPFEGLGPTDDLAVPLFGSTAMLSAKGAVVVHLVASCLTWHLALSRLRNGHDDLSWDVGGEGC